MASAQGVANFTTLLHNQIKLSNTFLSTNKCQKMAALLTHAPSYESCPFLKNFNLTTQTCCGTNTESHCRHCTRSNKNTRDCMVVGSPLTGQKPKNGINSFEEKEESIVRLMLKTFINTCNTQALFLIGIIIWSLLMRYVVLKRQEERKRIVAMGLDGEKMSLLEGMDTKSEIEGCDIEGDNIV